MRGDDENDRDPLRTVPSGTCYYFEGEERDLKCRHEGRIEVHPSWVCLGGPMPTWVPRERVEVVME